jgi:hypothetical protein
MPSAIQTSLSLVVMIILGYLLRGKLEKEEHKKGLKVVILDLALPAMIFVALMGVKLDVQLLFLPLIVLVWNGLMFAAGYFGLPLMGVAKDTASYRTWLLLLPSLAPGLSCFPFLIEYVGEEALAWAALGDFGNKVFVLIFSYFIAMAWFYRASTRGKRSGGEKARQLAWALVKEPINLVLVLAMILLSMGWGLQDLPGVLVRTVQELKNIMTPLVLLFIGVSVLLKRKQIQSILSLLMMRAGLSLILSGLFLSIVSLPSESAILLAVVFPLSSCSFWPFAHMSAIRQMEVNENLPTKTFDLDLGINILAVSLPFSTLLILGIFSVGDYFATPVPVVALGSALLFIPLLVKAIAYLKGMNLSLNLANDQEWKENPQEKVG